MSYKTIRKITASKHGEVRHQHSPETDIIDFKYGHVYIKRPCQ